MRLPSYLTLTISLTAALALAVPALADGVADGEIPDKSPVEGTEDKPDPADELDTRNPDAKTLVEKCRLTHLPQPDKGDESGSDEGDLLEKDEITASSTEEIEEVDTGDEVDGVAFADCVRDALHDIEGTTHEDAAVAVVVHGITSGYPDNTYRPGESMTREQMATTLFNALDLEVSGDLDLPDDVNPASVHATAIAALLKAGIAQGDEEGNFNPADEVRRGQMATFLHNADLLDELPDGTNVELPEDVKGSVHADAIAAALGNKVAQGFADGKFQPDAPVERGQMATIVTNTLKLDVFPETVPES